MIPSGRLPTFLQAFREDPELTLEGLEREAQARRERREAVRERTEEVAPRGRAQAIKRCSA